MNKTVGLWELRIVEDMRKDLASQDPNICKMEL